MEHTGIPTRGLHPLVSPDSAACSHRIRAHTTGIHREEKIWCKNAFSQEKNSCAKIPHHHGQPVVCTPPESRYEAVQRTSRMEWKHRATPMSAAVRKDTRAGPELLSPSGAASPALPPAALPSSTSGL